MWGLIIAQGLIMGGQYAYHRWFEEKPLKPRPADISLPRVDEGAPVPMVYGRCRVGAPIMVFAGNFHVPEDDDPIYHLDVMFVVGVPFFGGSASSPFNSIWAGDIRLGSLTDPAQGEGENQNVVAAEGADYLGISAVGEFYGGSQTQNVAADGTSTRTRMLLGGIDLTRIPGYRNQVCMAFVRQNFSGPGDGGLRLGFSPQVPAFRFEVIALSTGSASDLGQSLTEDADPAAVIYDLLTSPWGKLGLPASKIDLASFQAASAVLFAEEHGYSRAFEQVEEASEMIDDVLRQIDAVLYEEPTTGTLVLRLVRNDYDPLTLDEVNQQNATLKDYQVQGWSETPNQVRVSFTRRNLNYADGLCVGQNESNAVAQGGRRRPVDIRYLGCNTFDLAQKLASRELMVASRPRVKVTVVVDRTFYDKRPGDVVTFTWPELGIVRMPMRIARVDLGQLHDGKITLDMLRDVFDASFGAFPDA